LDGYPELEGRYQFGIGVVARYGENRSLANYGLPAYIGGVAVCSFDQPPCGGQNAAIGIGTVRKIAATPFNPSTDWHIYRLEARADALRLMIDGSTVLEGTDNRQLDGRKVGIFCTSNAQVNVRNFKVTSF
jgi:hypothetical protein